MFGCERKSVSVKWMQSEAIKVVTAAFLSFMLISHHLHIHPNATVCSMSPHTLTHTCSHTHVHARSIKQLLLACGIITPAGETQKRRVSVIYVCVTLWQRWDLKRAMQKNPKQQKKKSILCVCKRGIKWQSADVCGTVSEVTLPWDLQNFRMCFRSDCLFNLCSSENTHCLGASEAANQAFTCVSLLFFLSVKPLQALLRVCAD